MKTMLLLLLLAVAPLALADAALVLVTSSVSNGNTTTAGTPYPLHVVLRNAGNAPAHDVVLSLESDPVWIEASGISCAHVATRTSHTACRIGTVAPGEAIRGDFFLTSPEEGVMHVSVKAGAVTREHTISVSRTGRREDLSVRAAPEVVVKPGEPGILRVEVSTRGQNAANVRLGARTAAPRDSYEITASDPAVVCSREGFLCRIPFLWSHTPVTFEIRTAPRAADELLQFAFEVFGEDNLDLTTHNNMAMTTLFAGDASEWQRMLVPMPSQVTMFLRGDDEVDVRPAPCEFAISECIGTRPRNERIEFELTRAQIFYVRAKDAHKVTLKARLGDLELPIARGDDFTAGTISLLNIPSGDIELRVYDAAAVDTGLVDIHLYRADPAKPVLSNILYMRAMVDMKTTPARLPLFPAMKEIEWWVFGGIPPGAPPLRIDLEPRDPRQRIWAFLIVTDKKTGEKTVISQQ